MKKLLGFIALSAIACSDGGSKSQGPTYVVDTLPSGIKRTLSSAPAEPGKWEVVQLFDIKPEEDSEGELMNPSDIAITSDGTILVADNETHVKVFSANGEYLRTIGQAGSGPGEFRSAHVAARNDTLFVQDAQQARGSIFLLSTGEYLSSIPTSCCYWHPISYNGSGQVVVRSIISNKDSALGPSESFVKTAQGSSVTDTVFVFSREDIPNSSWRIESDRMMMAVQVPFIPRDIQIVDPKGEFITAWTGEYILRVTSNGRDTVEVFGRSFTPENVSGSEKQAIVDRRIEQMIASNPDMLTEPVLRKSFDVSFIPSTRPPFERMLADPAGRTWIVRSTSDTTRTLLDLFDTDRKWLDSIAVPYEQMPTTDIYQKLFFAENRVAAVFNDEDGFPYIRIYSINKK